MDLELYDSFEEDSAAFMPFAEDQLAFLYPVILCSVQCRYPLFQYALCSSQERVQVRRFDNRRFPAPNRVRLKLG